MNDAEQILELAETIKPVLAGKAPPIQAAVLAELTSTWLLGNSVLGSQEQTRALRSELLSLHCKLILELVALGDRLSTNGHSKKPH